MNKITFEILIEKVLRDTCIQPIGKVLLKVISAAFVSNGSAGALTLIHTCITQALLILTYDLQCNTAS